jgi:hypothetical protein
MKSLQDKIKHIDNLIKQHQKIGDLFTVDKLILKKEKLQQELDELDYDDEFLDYKY